MFVFGEKVIVNDPTLKSHNKVGLFVGVNKQNQGKVYFEKPIVTNGRNVSCIAVNLDKINHYAESAEDRIKDRLGQLTKRAEELRTELGAVHDEMYQLELQLMGRS